MSKNFLKIKTGLYICKIIEIKTSCLSLGKSTLRIFDKYPDIIKLNF